MNRIQEPTPNTPLSASWARDVTRALNRLRISGGRGVLVGQDAHGVNISLAPANPAVSGEVYAVPQWMCSIAVDDEAATVLRVRSGQLCWGGAHVTVWPSGDAVDRAVYGDVALAVPVGETHYVVWYTTAAPVPLAACPKNPTQTTEPCAECDGCTVGAPGDPASFVPDRGNVGIVATLTRQTDWTDMRVLATVEHTADGVYRVVQVQTAEIAVNAIVYPGESGEGEAPTCGHPGNDLDDDHPGDEGGSGAGGSFYTPGGTGHPGDDEGENGATPECGSESTEIDPFAD